MSEKIVLIKNKSQFLDKSLAVQDYKKSIQPVKGKNIKGSHKVSMRGPG